MTVKTSPRYVKTNCTACGDCANAATSEVANPFNYGMDKVKAAHLPHTMAFPMRYVVDPSVVGTAEGQAIEGRLQGRRRRPRRDRDQLRPGGRRGGVGHRLAPLSAANLTAYRWSDLANVVTNVEMERLASPDGPTKGRIVRPSDGAVPKKVALIQCAGSRDLNHLPYCSRICCLASMKHAAYVREQVADAQVDVYYIDLRAHDKLESFVPADQADPQVRFVKSKPARIEAGNGTIRWCAARTR